MFHQPLLGSAPSRVIIYFFPFPLVLGAPTPDCDVPHRMQACNGSEDWPRNEAEEREETRRRQRQRGEGVNGEALAEASPAGPKRPLLLGLQLLLLLGVQQLLLHGVQQLLLLLGVQLLLLLLGV